MCIDSVLERVCYLAYAITKLFSVNKKSTPYLYDVPLLIFSYDKIYLPKNKCGFFVHFLFYHTPPVHTEEALTLSDDRIEKAVRQNRVRLVIIDPVQAFIGADVDMNRANEVRPVFRKLGMIAEKTGCAIVLIGHLNKSSGTQSTYRGLGSIDIMAAVRSLIFIGKVRKDPTTRVLIHEKSSLAPPGETMAFKLGDEEGFRWVGAYEISADELLDGKEGKATETKLERGRKLIRELLADKKEISIRELDEKAKEQGISGRTMRDVRSRMKNELEYQVNEKQENSIRLKE